MSNLFNLTPKQRQYQRVSGLRFGAVFAAVVALAWTGIMTQYVVHTDAAMMLAVVYLLCLALLVRCLYILRREKPTQKITLPYLRSWRFWLAYYAVIIAEVVILFVLIRYLNSHNLPQAMWPLIVGVVALHWIPLGWLNCVPVWYYTAAFLIVGVLVTVGAIGHNSTIHTFGLAGSTWSIVSIFLMIVAMVATSLICLYRLTQLKK